MSQEATSAGELQGNLGILATLLPELVELIFSFADGQTKLALNRTCRGIHAALLGRKTVFYGNKPSTQLNLDTAGKPVAALRALHLAAHATQNVALQVYAQESAETASSSAWAWFQSCFCRRVLKDHDWLDNVLQPWSTGTTAADDITAAHGPAVITAGSVAEAKQPVSLQQINSIQLTCMQLQHPFPTCIAQAFPHLQHYTLAHVQWPPAVAMGGFCWLHLQSLEIENSSSLRIPQTLGPKNLPALTELQLTGHPESEFTTDEQKDVMSACMAFSQHLACLKIDGHSMDKQPAILSRLFHDARFPQLTKVHIGWKLTDVGFLELLAACPVLKQLHVGSLVLMEQHGSERCMLEHLSFGPRAGMAETLSHLPYTPKALNVLLHPVLDLSIPINEQAMSAALGRMHVCVEQDSLWLVCQEAQCWKDTAISNLDALHPVLQLSHLNEVFLVNGLVSKALLEALSPTLSSGVEVLEFWGCFWEPQATEEFWSLAPHTKELRFYFVNMGDRCAVAAVALVCCTAVRPVTVHASPLDAQNQELINQAVQSAGKGHLVTLEMFAV